MNIFKCFNFKKINPIDNTLLNNTEYNASGCIFTDNNLILAGYQPTKRKPFISGLGGMKKTNEDCFITALRETIEELLEIGDVPLSIINKIRSNIKPVKIIQNNDYIIIVYTFKDLEKILKICNKQKSLVYDKIPIKLNDLLFNRKNIKDTEISHLCLLPVIYNHDINNPFVDKYFLSDLSLLKNN